MRTACSTLGAPKHSSTGVTRSKIGHWQNRSAIAGVCVRSVTRNGVAHTSGFAVARAASAAATPARMAAHDCAGKGDFA